MQVSLRDNALSLGLGLSLELLNESNSFTNLVVELGIVVEVALDIIDGEIDEHASDLGGASLSNDSLDVGIDELTNHLLEVGVALEDGGDKGETLLVVGIDLGIRVRKVSGA